MAFSGRRYFVLEKKINKIIFETLPVPQAVRKFVVPSLLSTLIFIIYSLADTFFVGLIGDPNQLAGLTVAFPFFQVLNAFGSLFGVGSNSVISRSLGEKRYECVSRASELSFWSGVLFMVFACITLHLFQRPLLLAAGASVNTYDYAAGYLRWTFVYGGIPSVLSITMCNLLRAEGHAKQGSIGLILGGLLNCVLDPIFIFTFQLEIVGAAIATMLSNCFSLFYFLVVYLRIRQTSYISLCPFGHRFEWSLLKEILLVGLPSCWLTILGSTGCLFQTFLYSKHSDIAVAAWGVVNRISFVSIYSTHGVAQGVMPLIGYNFGAKNYSRVRAVNQEAFKIVLMIAFSLLIFSEAFSAGIVRVFINDLETIAVGSVLMRYYMLCTPFMSMILTISTLFQAVGKWQYSLVILTIRQFVFNIPLMFLLNSFMGIRGVALGQPTSDFINLFLVIYVYRRYFFFN